MLHFAADENFNGDIVRGRLRRNPQIDIVRVQDVGLSGADDPSVLQWAARENRVVVTHDISTFADTPLIVLPPVTESWGLRGPVHCWSRPDHRRFDLARRV